MMSEILLEVESLDLEARGVARLDGKVVFVPGALPGERVAARIAKRKPGFDTAQLLRVVRPSAQRREPPCPHFGVCGGCLMQHLEPAAQVAVKQRVLEDTLWHVGRVRPARMLPPMHGPYWGYRHRARLSVRVVRKKGGVLVGFREKRSSYVADMQRCLILPPPASALLMPLRALVGGLSQPDTIPQIELAVGESATVLNLRHMAPLTPADVAALEAFAAAHGIVWWLQPKGPETAHPLHAGDEDRLDYSLPAHGVRMHYRPADFTQVNTAINRSLVSMALGLLQVQAGDRVADLFCGLGNFTLPLARSAAAVMGVEGSATLIERARQAARAHRLDERLSFAVRNLFEVDAAWLRSLGRFDRMLVDPPRDGAHALAQALAELAPAERPGRIVYVSCNPATLARDAGILAGEGGGYRLSAAGVVNMFPHTGHVESIAVFDLLAGRPAERRPGA